MLKDTFTKIYKNKNWQDIYGTESGPGSSIECSKPYLDFLQEFCNSYSIKSILDLGCGDFNLMRYFDFVGIDYLGIDVVDHVIVNNKQLYENTNIKFKSQSIIDYSSDISYDLILCKDVLQHLNQNNVFKVLNIKNYKYALYTNDFSEGVNNNVEDGNYSPIDLSKTPYSVNCECVFEWQSCFFKKRVYKVF
jgi:SAM-dependent methyltransferase